MNHKPDIGLVDAKPEGFGRHDDIVLVVHERALGLLPLRRLHLAVIATYAKSRIPQFSP